jgi:ferritin
MALDWAEERVTEAERQLAELQAADNTAQPSQTGQLLQALLTGQREQTALLQDIVTALRAIQQKLESNEGL